LSPSVPLTPGQRIDLKKRISATLSQQEWRHIDLTLEEFGFATTDNWEHSTEAYVLEMLRAAGSDEALAQLDSYLHPEAGPTAMPQPDAFDDPSSPWPSDGFRLFLSHIHQDRVQAAALREELAKRSISAFVAHDSIEPTEDWQNTILAALRTCHGCLALLSAGFSESKWTDQEIGFCMARDLVVIPVEWGLNPYGFLGKYQALPIKPGLHQADIALAVFELLVRKRQSRDTMAGALVARWANTGSFEAARENYSFLKKIPKEAWTQRLVNAVWEARDRKINLREASINWKPSEEALRDLFCEIPFSRPALEHDDDEPPW
jgi:hypothetical protein